MVASFVSSLSSHSYADLERLVRVTDQIVTEWNENVMQELRECAFYCMRVFDNSIKETHSSNRIFIFSFFSFYFQVSILLEPV